MQCSELNAHLFSLLIVDSLVGITWKTRYIILLHCPPYTLPGLKMLQSTQTIGINALHVETLLYVFDYFVYSSNKEILKAVNTFIKETERL